MWQLSRQNISRKIIGRIFFDPENLPCEKNGPWSDSNGTFAAPAVLVNTRVIVQEKRTNCAQIRKGKKGLKLVKSCYMSDSNLRFRDMKSHILPSQTRTFNNCQKLATNEAENRCYEISYARDRECGKVSPNEHIHLPVR